MKRHYYAIDTATGAVHRFRTMRGRDLYVHDFPGMEAVYARDPRVRQRVRLSLLPADWNYVNH